jgi:Domain of unknown function (DUF4402)
MRQLMTVTFVLLCTVAGSADAQVQATASVKATVQQDLQLTSEGETDFGTIGSNAHTEVIDPKAPKTTQTTAQFTSTSSNVVQYTCPAEVTLTGPGAASMTFIPSLTAHTANEQSASEPFFCPSAYLNISPAFFWLGGSLKVLANQEPGSYSGVFTLTVTYQ